MERTLLTPKSFATKTLQAQNVKYPNTAKLAEQIIQDKTKYKKRKLAETNGRKSDLVRRPLGQELNPEVFCEALGQVAHSVVSCLHQRSDPIITDAVFDLN